MFLIAYVVNALVSRCRCVADQADRGLMVGGADGLGQGWSPTASLRRTGIGHRRGRDQRHLDSMRSRPRTPAIL